MLTVIDTAEFTVRRQAARTGRSPSSTGFMAPRKTERTTIN